jgi:predicted phage-related endonuclease
VSRTDCVQGSPDAWHALRAQFLTASEAPAMMGVHSSNASRTELLRMKKTGIAREVTECNAAACSTRGTTPKPPRVRSWKASSW